MKRKRSWIAIPQRALDAKIMWWSLCGLRWLRRRWGMGHATLTAEMLLTQRTGLFDRDFYQSQLHQAQLSTQGQSLLQHYVEQGDAQGLAPAPLFDVEHYDAHCGAGSAARRGLNRALHYALVARFAGKTPSPWFDPDHYLRTYPDVRTAGVEPFAHFLHSGWNEGRSPLPGLDIQRLLRLRPGLYAGTTRAGDGLAALRLSAENGGAAHKPADALPDVLDPLTWADLEPRRWATEPALDVFVPVYAGLRETLRCLWTVLTTPVQTPHRVVVINDAGPEPELNAMLRSLAARGLFILEQHERNQGFVKTVNHGFRLAATRDVLILNSDTEVYNDWLDRLVAQMRAHPRLGTLTPLSNNATICSYPQTLMDNRLPLEVSHAELDRLAAQVNRGRHVPAPTGVGFCMYIRQEALAQVGGLDERHFGRGYGEENDLCQRMLRKGWINGIACDVYVRHVGSVSFQSEATGRIRKALKTLARLHPHYEADVARYIAEDPTHPSRVRLDLARMAQHTTERNVLLVCHNRGGGTERHLMEQARELVDQGCGVFELRPAAKPGPYATLTHADLLGLPNLAALALHPSDLLDEALRGLRITEIHVHHLVDFDAKVGPHLLAAAQRHRIPIRVTVHDYHWMCPRVNLVTPAGRYCGEPDAAGCDRCLAQAPEVPGVRSIRVWREEAQRWLHAARQVVVPSADVARRLATLAPQASVSLEPHEHDIQPGMMSHRPAPAHEGVRVLVIGAISPIKGMDVLLQLMPLARVQQPVCELLLLGYSSDDARLAAAGVRLLGRYTDDQLLTRIEQADPHVIFIPSIWPETYCYVLSGALRSGRKVAVFDLGAQADRTRQHDARHLVLPLALAEQPAPLLARLVSAARC